LKVSLNDSANHLDPDLGVIDYILRGRGTGGNAGSCRNGAAGNRTGRDGTTGNRSACT
jgi:hypothetical protein